jgi:hypothetical protein
VPSRSASMSGLTACLLLLHRLNLQAFAGCTTACNAAQEASYAYLLCWCNHHLVQQLHSIAGCEAVVAALAHLCKHT